MAKEESRALWRELMRQTRENHTLAKAKSAHDVWRRRMYGPVCDTCGGGHKTAFCPKL